MEHQPIQRDRSALSRRLRRWDTIALLIPLAIVLSILGVLIANHGGAPSLTNESWPPPDLFRWSGQATLTSQTAQQAFASGVQLRPCISPLATPAAFGSPARATTITWLVNSSSYGLARIQAICDPPAPSLDHQLWLFVLDLYPAEPTREWSPNGGGEFALGPESTTQPLPSWLPLPADTYRRQFLPGPSYASVALWEGQTRFFVFGHIADHAIRPDGATSVKVNGAPGWMTAEDGLATITVVRADGTTLFFSGTATPAEAQALAAQAFAHVDEALQPLQSPASATTPSVTLPPGY